MEMVGGTGTHVAGQAEPGHRAVVETAVLGSGTRAVGGGRASAGRGYWWRMRPGLRHCSRRGVEAGDG